MSKKICVRHLQDSTLAGQSAQFDGDKVLLGRQANCDVRFDPAKDRSVSGRHAEVRREGGGENGTLVVEDLGSSNGTYVNGVRISGPTPLMPRDRVRLGEGGPELGVTLLDVNPNEAATVVSHRPGGTPTPPATPTTPAVSAAPGKAPVKLTPAPNLAAASRPPGLPPSRASQGLMKSSIGMNTLMGVLGEERQKERRRVFKSFAVVGAAIAAFVLIATIPLIWYFQADPQVSWGEVYSEAADSVYVVMIRDENGNVSPQGTAWSVAEGKLATNAHVAELFDSLQPGQQLLARRGSAENDLKIKSVTLHPGYKAFARLSAQYVPFDAGSNRLLNFVPACDVALMEVGQFDGNGARQAPALPLSTSEQWAELSPGYNVAYIGFPMEGRAGGGLDVDKPEPNRDSGSLTRLSDSFLATADRAEVMLLGHNLPTLGGASGSPILNREGRVIGLISAGDNVGMGAGGRISLTGFAYGPHVRLLRELLDGSAETVQKERSKEWRERLLTDAREGVRNPESLMIYLAGEQLAARGIDLASAEVSRIADESLKLDGTTSKTLQFPDKGTYAIVVASTDPAAEYSAIIEGAGDPVTINDAPEAGENIRRYYGAVSFQSGGPAQLTLKLAPGGNAKPDVRYIVWAVKQQ